MRYHSSSSRKEYLSYSFLYAPLKKGKTGSIKRALPCTCPIVGSFGCLTLKFKSVSNFEIHNIKLSLSRKKDKRRYKNETNHFLYAMEAVI